jgi:hypothetical protein
MKTIRYRFVVDSDVQKLYNITDPENIAFLIATYLNSPHGWGYFFEPVTKNEDVLIRLSSPKTIKSKCGLPQNLSCAEMNGKNMYLNADRWFHGAPKSKQNLDGYRQYVVLHEMGHILGHEHKKCPCKGCPAPIMMQQTLGIGECKPNTHVR